MGSGRRSPRCSIRHKTCRWTRELPTAAHWINSAHWDRKPCLGRAVHDMNMAKGCCAGLWLYHNYLDESHAISQGVHTSSGSFWHSVMHRREGDFSNAKYWFRQTGEHAVFEPLCAEARKLAMHCGHPRRRFLESQSDWDPFAFVDLCQEALAGDQELDAVCRKIQTCEWRLLFEHCFRAAIE